MSWNTQLFLLLNGPAAPDPATLFGMRMLADSPVVIAPALLAWLWVRRPDHRRGGLLAVALAALAGQAANLALGALWFEPRPFMAGIGHSLLAHRTDTGFPSDHSTLMFALGTGLMLTGAARAAGAAVCVLGLGVGWARVYLGVHFPIDVLTGIPVGAAAGGLARLIQPLLRRHALPPAERLYGFTLAALRLPAAVFPRGER
jgi:undecaprenyl-diphosphatase